MAVIREPIEDRPERWRWLAEADRDTRAANPKYYWFHTYDSRIRFFWDEIEVTEDEFRNSADQVQIDQLNELL